MSYVFNRFSIDNMIRPKLNRCKCVLIIIATEGDAIEENGSKLTRNVDDGAVCKFGSLSLKRGQSLKAKDKCNTCTCNMPPLLTCTKTYNC